MALLLFAMGVTAILLRAWLRIPLNIPGRQGMLVMMIFMTGRALSEARIGGIWSAAGASLMLIIPGIGPRDPWLPLIFLGMGTAIDLLVYTGKRLHGNPILVYVLAGGMAYALIPLSRMSIAFLTAHPYTEFIKHGYMIPLLTHFIFGATGSLLGTASVVVYRKRRSHHESS